METARVVLSWIPIVGRFCRKKKETVEPPEDLPSARVAVIGAGVGGTSAAYFLRQSCGDNLEIHVFSDGAVGGRMATVSIGGRVYESGGSVIHKSNQHMLGFAEEFELGIKSSKDEPTTPLGVFNGRKFTLWLGAWGFINTLKLLWRYGISLIRLRSCVNAVIKKFCTIYRLQSQGKSFATVPDMLRAMGGDYLFQLTQVNTSDFMLNRMGYSQRLVDEIVCPALRVNYGQNTDMDAFTALVALAGMQDDSLWSVQGGNKLVPEKTLEASKSFYHHGMVTTVSRDTSKGRVQYTVYYKDFLSGGDEKEEFDIVIVASPLNLSSIKYEDFPVPVYTPPATTPFHRTIATFVKGEINPSFFGVPATTSMSKFPLTILTEKLEEGCPVDLCSVSVLVPADVPSKDEKDYLKPLSQDPVRLWKVFSPKPLTEEEKGMIFKSYKENMEVDWMAYPEYNPPEAYPPFILDDGMFYVNPVEKAASCMEMSAIGAKNCALLAKEYLLKA